MPRRGGVEFEALVFQEVEQPIVGRREVAGVLILEHARAKRFGVFVLPQERAVVSVVGLDRVLALDEQSTAGGERADRTLMTVDHITRTGIAEPEDTKIPLHALVETDRRVGGIPILMRPVAGTWQRSARQQ